METIQNSTTRITIRENWDIGVIEKHLESCLPNCIIWGDLNINPEEYKNIMTKIESALGCDPTVSNLKQLIKRYPVVLVTDIISFVLYEFDNNTFWNAWSSRYNIELCTNNQTEIGKMVHGIFERFDFEIIEEGGYAYVTPILCQAGIPVVCFDKLFDIFDSTINSSYFNAREIVNELMGYRSYLIDITAERYFKRHTEKAIELVAQLREMMRSVVDLSGLESNEIPEFPGVPKRIVHRYALWNAEIKKIGRRSRRNTQFYFSPKIVYDETKGICLFIPEQTLRDDSIYKLRWIISSEEIESNKMVYSQVYNDNIRNYTLETVVPLAPASSYMVELYDDDDDANPLTSPWTIEVFGSDNLILAFNEAGSLMLPTQRYISRKGTIIVFDSSVTPSVQSHSINHDNINLPKTWSDFQAIRVYPADKNALLVLTNQNDVYRIECKHSFDIELEQTGTLFDEKYRHTEIPVYTRFPNVDIVGDIPNENQAIFDNWQIVISHRLSNTKHVAMFTELPLSISGENALVNLDDYAQKYFANIYGAYELRIYDGKTIRKNITFYLVTPIRYFARREDFQSDRIFEKKDAAFWVHKKDVPLLEFEPGSGISVLPGISKSDDWVELSTQNKQAYIYGNIIVKDGQRIPFKKTIRRLEWSFWDEKENDVKDVGKTKQFYLEDFKATNWRLFLHFTDAWAQCDSIKLVLETADCKQLQSKDIIVDNFGNCLITLNMFQDTIERHPLPQKVMLYITKGHDEYLPITIALIKSFVQLNNAQYRQIQGNPSILWDENNSNNLKNKKLELTSLNNPNMEPIIKSLEAVKVFKRKDGTIFEGVFLDEPLSNGVYLIDAKEDVEFSFFDDEEQSIPTYDSNHILCVNGRQYLDNHYANNTINVAEWLSATEIAQNRIEWVSELTERLKECIERSEMLFDAEACSPILFSLLINTGYKSNLSSEKKRIVKEICKLINDHAITNIQRTELLKILLDSSVSNEDCKEIVNELQLYLFCPTGSTVFDKTALHRMWDINEKLAILINLRNSATTLSIDIDRVIGRIGSETLEKIITFQRDKSCESSDWSECFERLVGNKCTCNSVVFETSKQVWGDRSEYSKLFVSDKKSNWSREEPNEHSTDGYDFFGKTYLKLIYDLIPDIQDEESKKYTELAKMEIYKVEELSAKYKNLIHNLQPVIQNRLGDGSGSHKLFYQIGCASALTALSTKRVIDPANLQELLPFWKYATTVYSDLVYRDLIISELYALQNRGRSLTWL